MSGEAHIGQDLSEALNGSGLEVVSSHGENSCSGHSFKMASELQEQGFKVSMTQAEQNQSLRSPFNAAGIGLDFSAKAPESSMNPEPAIGGPKQGPSV